MRTFLLVAVISLSGCSSLNSLGLGGEPLLMCKSRDATAFLDDSLVGSDSVHLTVGRRFKDGDSLCMALKPAPAASAPLK